jgi:dienelactone hydrolase
MKHRFLSAPVLAVGALSLLPIARAEQQLQLQPIVFVFWNSDFRDVRVDAPESASAEGKASADGGHALVIKSPSTIHFDDDTLALKGSEFKWSTGDTPPGAISLVPVSAMRFGLNQLATIRCVVPAQYMEKRSDGTFRLQEIASDSPEVPRFVLSFHVEPGRRQANELLVTCQPEVATIRGREKIPGVDLEIGRPQMSSFNDEIKLAVQKGEWSMLLFRAPKVNDYSVLALFKIDEEPASPPQSASVSPAAAIEPVTKMDFFRDTPVPATEQVPIFDFFRPPVLREPKLNLDGTHIAAIASAPDDTSQLMVYDVKTKAFERTDASRDFANDIYSVRWLNSTRLVFRISYYKHEDRGLFAADLGALFDYYPLITSAPAWLIAVPPGDRLHPVVRLAPHTGLTGRYGEVVVLSSGAGIHSSAYLRDAAENGIKHIVSHYPVLKMDARGDFRYLTDIDGKLAFGFGDQEGILSLHQLVGDTWRQCPEDLEEIHVIESGNHPGEILVLGKREGGKPRPLERMDAASGKVLDVLWQDPAYDFDGELYRDPKSNQVLGAIGQKAKPFSVWFDEGMRKLQQELEKKFPDLVVRILGTDEAGKMVLFSTFSDRQPAIYYWADLEKKTIGVFNNSMPWIDPQRMQPMGVRKFKTRDGREFDAYLTLPKGAPLQNPPPLVVLPHDRTDYGLSSPSTWGYDEEVQFLASRGYAVLQPNFRGTAGSTWMYPKEDEWDFRKMNEDVTDATNDLIASGLVDRNRIAIMGSGFGGYLALCGAAFEPSLYRCAIAISAHYDWGELIEEAAYNKYKDPLYFRMLFKLGDPKKEPEKFDAISPLKHAADIRVPVLVSYGEYDSSAAISRAKDLISTVKKKGIAAAAISFRDERGGAHYLDHRVELYQRIEAFLAENLRAGNQ